MNNKNSNNNLESQKYLYTEINNYLSLPLNIFVSNKFQNLFSHSHVCYHKKKLFYFILNPN